MKNKFFGTDGIRGKANTFPISTVDAMYIGMAAGEVLKRGGSDQRVIIGKDTRVSGYMLETALVAGLTSVGMHALQVGPVPTPAVAHLTRSLRADFGIMISASHNSYEDNGIKFFDRNGRKLSDELQHEIELAIHSASEGKIITASSENIGRAKRIEAVSRYVEFCKVACARNLQLDGLRVVIDAANGAAYKVIPEVLWELGAEVIAIGDKPNGFNINRECGSTSPRAMINKVIETRADIGFAVDGDADRLIVCDENGELIDGDQILALITAESVKNKTLKGGGIVGTILSNLQLEKWVERQNLKFIRSAVGDRHVIAAMEKYGMNIGGETSGHIILTDYGTTGDALLSMLQVLNHYVDSNKPASEVLKIFEASAQFTRNVPRLTDSKVLDEGTAGVIDKFNKKLQGEGRIIVRPSGTEPVIRIMVEHNDETVATSYLDKITDLLNNPNYKTDKVEDNNSIADNASKVNQTSVSALDEKAPAMGALPN